MRTSCANPKCAVTSDEFFAQNENWKMFVSVILPDVRIRPSSRYTIYIRCDDERRLFLVECASSFCRANLCRRTDVPYGHLAYAESCVVIKFFSCSSRSFSIHSFPVHRVRIGAYKQRKDISINCYEFIVSLRIQSIQYRVRSTDCMSK